MAVLVHRASHVHPALPTPLLRRAWTALALVPLGWVVSVSAALGTDPDLSDGLSTAGGVLVGMVALAAPVAAVVLSDLADGAGERSGHATFLFSGVLLFVTLVGLPRLLVSTPAFVITLAICLVTLTVGLLVARRHQRQR